MAGGSRSLYLPGGNSTTCYYSHPCRRKKRGSRQTIPWQTNSLNPQIFILPSTVVRPEQTIPASSSPSPHKHRLTGTCNMVHINPIDGLSRPCQPPHRGVHGTYPSFSPMRQRPTLHGLGMVVYPEFLENRKSAVVRRMGFAWRWRGRTRGR